MNDLFVYSSQNMVEALINELMKLLSMASSSRAKSRSSWVLTGSTVAAVTVLSPAMTTPKVRMAHCVIVRPNHLIDNDSISSLYCFTMSGKEFVIDRLTIGLQPIPANALDDV